MVIGEDQYTENPLADAVKNILYATEVRCVTRGPALLFMHY